MSSQPSAPAAAPAAPAAPAPVVAPVNATMSAFAPLERVAFVATPTVHTHTAAAVAAARALGREGQTAAPETQAPTAPVGDQPIAPTAAPEKPAETPAEPKDSPTARIAQLTRARREAEARERVASQRADAAAAEAAAAKKEAAALATIREAFKKDPLQAFKELGENWADIVDRVASGGVPPSPEELAAAAKEKASAEVAARLKALEDERLAEKTDAQKRAEVEAEAGARKYVADKLISAEKHPRLVAFAEDAAQEALEQVNSALERAVKEGKRTSPYPVDLDESLHLTALALDGLNSFYDDLANKLAPPAAKQQAAPTPTVQAVTAPVATSKQRGPDTITNAVAGVSPPAAQPRHMTPDEARAEVMRLARAMPQ